MTAIEILKCQDDIVTTLASAIRNPWRLVAVNIEIDVIDGDHAENYVALSYRRKFWRFVWRSEELPREVSDLFMVRRSMMEREDASPWGSCTLAFDKTGQYRFEYFYDKLTAERNSRCQIHDAEFQPDCVSRSTWCVKELAEPRGEREPPMTRDLKS